MARSSIFSIVVGISIILLKLILIFPVAEGRAFFVFGDSLVDNGNNNYLATSARADAPPYGIDFPTHRPTGRFSNGLNIPDIISSVSFSFFFFNMVSEQEPEPLINYIHIYCFFFFIGERMGMEAPQPYLSPHLKGDELLNGANFASAGVGILNDTGFQFVSLNKQENTFFKKNYKIDVSFS